MTVTQGGGSSVSILGRNAVVNPRGDELGFPSESGSILIGGLSQRQHSPALHDDRHPPHVWAKELSARHKTADIKF